MEPATALALAADSLKVLKEIIKFCQECKEAYKDLPLLILLIEFECNTWNALLARLETRLKTSNPLGPSLDLAPFRVLEKVRDCIYRLQAFVSAKALQDGSDIKTRIKQALKWTVLEKRKVHGILDELDPIKRNFYLALDVDTNFGVGELQKQIQHVEKTIIGQSRQIQAMNRIKPHDIIPTETHRQKKALRVDETCDWIIESELWQDWLQGGSESCCRFLFIHGIAGSGKTILASALIDELLHNLGKRTVEERQAHVKGFSYYYCSHEHNVDEKRPFLRWIIYDLCRQLGDYVPESLADIADASEIPDEVLLKCFLAISKQFKERVYLVVDAVDECRSPRAGFLEVLTTIGASQSYKHVSLLVTGRLEPDINRAIGSALEDKHKLPLQTTSPLKRTSHQTTPESSKRRRFDPALTSAQNGEGSGLPRLLQEPVSPSPRTPDQDSGQSDTEPENMNLDADEKLDEKPQPLLTIPASLRNGCTKLDMDNIYVRQAIELYVHKQLEDIGFWRTWGEKGAFTLEIKKKLAEKARGMFRLASCQIEMLRNGSLYDDKAVREAVNTMPDTIFDMYKGLVVKWVPGANAQNHVARNALALICSSTSEIPCAEVLVEAARLDVSSNTSLIKFTLKNLRDLLGCLIKITAMERKPESVFQRNEDDVIFKQVLPAHYTVKEFVYDKTTAADPRVGYFAQTKASNLILELQIVWAGLTHWGQHRPANNRKTPTRFEEYCLKMTDKSLRLHRPAISEEKSIYEHVFPCLGWSSPHFSQVGRTRRAFPTWLQINQQVVYQKDGSPSNENTSILVSLLLLDWPELAKKLLSTLAPKERKAVLKDEFSLERRPQKDFATTSDLAIQPQTNILKACVALRKVSFLQALIDCGADFLGEPGIIYYPLELHCGTDPVASEEFSTTDSLLKSLLDAGADPCPRGYLFTPLQHIVTFLEEPWVHTLVYRLQYRNGNINMVGTPGGRDPYCKDDGNDEEEYWWYTQHPLKICRCVIPGWGKDAGEDEVDQARIQIDLLLRTFGAFETDKKQPRSSRGAGLVVNISDDEDDALA
ncbi:hypothetical protein PG993_009782 [Apiospora rasikravindrae]|uniref:Nephrocystin 3-like N-terminal domain-containing protein n=1 Tax=Apiospora rasikravindrae TaxID=990691 RepID=A0ABR1SKC3_9PEZI